MVYKVFFLIIFAFLFVYSLIRPFANIYSRLFLFFGSIAGIISLLGSKYANLIAGYIGVENGSYLYLYIGLVTIFMFFRNGEGALTFSKINVFSLFMMMLKFNFIKSSSETLCPIQLNVVKRKRKTNTNLK